MTEPSNSVSSIQINRDAPDSLHSQISEAIRSRIASAEWPSHYRLKSESELVEQLGVSRGTLRRALTTLVDEGLLKQIRGRGTFVTSTTPEPAIAQRLSTLSEDFAYEGIVADTTVVECNLIEPPRHISALLDIPQEAQVMKLSRIRSTNAGPVALLYNYVRTDVAPGIEYTDFRTASLFATLEDRYGLPIGSARRTFSAEATSDEIADLLDTESGVPVQYLQQVTYLTDSTPVEYSDVWIHSGRLRVTSLLSRK